MEQGLSRSLRHALAVRLGCDCQLLTDHSCLTLRLYPLRSGQVPAMAVRLLRLLSRPQAPPRPAEVTGEQLP